ARAARAPASATVTSRAVRARWRATAVRAANTSPEVVLLNRDLVHCAIPGIPKVVDTLGSVDVAHLSCRTVLGAVAGVDSAGAAAHGRHSTRHAVGPQRGEIVFPATDALVD